MSDPVRREPRAAAVSPALARSFLALPLATFLLQPLVAQDTQKAPHGAMAMDAQLKRLDALLPDDLLAPPQGVDPELWRFYIPDDNEMTRERIELGRDLYFDLRLSRDGTVSCATCHDVSRGFTDQRPVSEGIDDQLGHRNAPTTLNAALITPQFLDGRAADLEEQAGMPILNPIEMGQPDEQAVVDAVRAIPEYPPRFRAAFGRDVEYGDIERAIAAFERTLIFLDAPFDRFLAGDEDALTDAERKGWILYSGKARCITCHPLNASNPLGTDFRFHNVGVSARHQDFERLVDKALDALAKDDSEQAIDELAVGTDLSELGRFMVTRDRSHIGAFRTLQVRNVGITPPYMHDGSMETLWDVMDHYNKGGEPNPFLDGGMEPLALSEEEIDQVVAFLFALTDERFAEQNDAQRRSQRQRADEKRPFRDEDIAQRRVMVFQARAEGRTRDPDDGSQGAQHKEQDS